MIKSIWELFNSKYNDASRYTEEETKLTEEVLSDVQTLLELDVDKNDYFWHDIRKNPDDLPKNEELVLCEWVGGSHNWHDVFMFWEKPRNCFTNTHGTYISIVGDEKFSQEGQVVAWKYIEPFEEEEEE